jgi:hypothetical protein
MDDDKNAIVRIGDEDDEEETTTTTTANTNNNKNINKEDSEQIIESESKTESTIETV